MYLLEAKIKFSNNVKIHRRIRKSFIIMKQNIEVQKHPFQEMTNIRLQTRCTHP